MSVFGRDEWLSHCILMALVVSCAYLVLCVLYSVDPRGG